MSTLTDSDTMSNRLDRLFLLFMLLCRMKYFCAWLATWVGVRVCTKFREIPLQSPFPSFCNPSRNKRCSSSVHGTPATIRGMTKRLDGCTTKMCQEAVQIQSFSILSAKKTTTSFLKNSSYRRCQRLNI